MEYTLCCLYGALQDWSPITFVFCPFCIFLSSPGQGDSPNLWSFLIKEDMRRLGQNWVCKLRLRTERHPRFQGCQGLVHCSTGPWGVPGPLEARVWLWAHLRRLHLGPEAQDGCATAQQDLQTSRDCVHWTVESQRWPSYPEDREVLQNILLNLRPLQSS